MRRREADKAIPFEEMEAYSGMTLEWVLLPKALRHCID